MATRNTGKLRDLSGTVSLSKIKDTHYRLNITAKGSRYNYHDTLDELSKGLSEMTVRKVSSDC